MESRWGPLDACSVAHSSPSRMSTRSVRPSFVTEKQHSAVAIIIADIYRTSPHHLKSPSFGKKRRLKYSMMCFPVYEPPCKCLCTKKRSQGNVYAKLRSPLVVATVHGSECPMVMECYGRFFHHGCCSDRHGRYAALDIRMVPDQLCFKPVSCPVHHSASRASPQGTHGPKGCKFTDSPRVGLNQPRNP